MRSSQVAAAAGVNVETLRYYERVGLLPEPDRSPAGYRSYDTNTVRVVRFVKRAQRLGFSLDEISSLLHLAAGGPRSCRSARALASERLAELEGRIAELTAMRDSLAQLVETCDQSPGRRQCPLLDALDDVEPAARTTPVTAGVP
jgi:Hg(II)-responsive transcriptional regulator